LHAKTTNTNDTFDKITEKLAFFCSNEKYECNQETSTMCASAWLDTSSIWNPDACTNRRKTSHL